MSKIRPLGITVYGYLSIVMAIANLLVYFLSRNNLLAKAIIGTFNIFYVSIGIGLLSLKKWARKLFLILSWFFVSLLVFALLNFRLPFTSVSLISFGLLIYLFGIYYFTRKRVVTVFYS